MTIKKATIRLPQPEVEESSWLKIGEVSKRNGIGIEALRFYEKSGLIDPPGHAGSGYRQYDASVLDRLEFIKRAQALGFSLNEIAQIYPVFVIVGSPYFQLSHRPSRWANVMPRQSAACQSSRLKCM